MLTNIVPQVFCPCCGKPTKVIYQDDYRRGHEGEQITLATCNTAGCTLRTYTLSPRDLTDANRLVKYNGAIQQFDIYTGVAK